MMETERIARITSEAVDLLVELDELSEPIGEPVRNLHQALCDRAERRHDARVRLRELAQLLRTAGIVLALALVGCAARTGPDVEVSVAPDRDAEAIRLGAGEWRDLGFELVDVTSALPDCPLDWYVTGDVDCRLFVAVDRADLGADIAGLSDRGARRIILSTRLAADDYAGRLELWSVAAHEFGHVLLNCGEHLADGLGVMSSPAVGQTPTDDDYALACETRGLCI